MRHFKETKNQGFFRVSWGGGRRDRCVSTREGDAEYLKRRQLSRLQFTLYRKNYALGKNRQVMKRAKWYLVVKPSSMVACSAVNVLTRTESVEFHSFFLHYYRYGSGKKCRFNYAYLELWICVASPDGSTHQTLSRFPAAYFHVIEFYRVMKATISFSFLSTIRVS